MATTHKFRKVIYSSLFGLGLTAGGVTLASAATNQQQPPTTVEAPDAAAKPEGVDVGVKSDDQPGADEKPNSTSSVTVPVTPEKPEGAEESDADEAKADKAEQAKLEKVAKIDAKAASKAATDKVPGTVGEVELDEEAGNVVYEVEVTAKDGTETDVIVDAGNGKILAQEVDDGAADDKAEQAKLEKEAKIDANAATKAATDKVPGTAAKPELDEENNQVVYEVEVTAKDGTVTEVIVDATSGRILAQQAD